MLSRHLVNSSPSTKQHVLCLSFYMREADGQCNLSAVVVCITFGSVTHAMDMGT